MQDPKGPLSGDISNARPRKTKVSNRDPSLIHLHGNGIGEVQRAQGAMLSGKVQSASKRNPLNESPPFVQEQEISNSDSLPNSSTSGDKYRALRRKYLLLEEESFALGRELKDVEDEVKGLQDEKLALLDQLVVLEGLIDPSECNLRDKINS